MIFLRAIAVWLVIIAAETAHGILRTLLIAPAIGDFRSRQLGVFVGSLIVLGVVYTFICWLKAVEVKELLLIGSFWAILTFVFEVGLGKLVGLSNDRIFEDYDLLNGGLMPLGIAFLIVTPLIATHLKQHR